MQNCRILNSDDRIIIPSYVQLFNRVLTEISPFYDPSLIQESREKYVPDYIESKLVPNSERRFIGHFTDQRLDGILIEGFDNLDGPRTTINWVMAETKNSGIGTQLIEDCIDRAKSEHKFVVALVVPENNILAIRLYKKLGFIQSDIYNNETMRLMGYEI